MKIGFGILVPAEGDLLVAGSGGEVLGDSWCSSVSWNEYITHSPGSIRSIRPGLQIGTLWTVSRQIHPCCIWTVFRSWPISAMRLSHITEGLPATRTSGRKAHLFIIHIGIFAAATVITAYTGPTSRINIRQPPIIITGIHQILCPGHCLIPGHFSITIIIGGISIIGILQPHNPLAGTCHGSITIVDKRCIWNCTYFIREFALIPSTIQCRNPVIINLPIC